MIRHAKISEIPDILIITRACTVQMEKYGIFQWNEHYPSYRDFENDVSRGELYVFDKNGKILGTVVLSTHMDQEYGEVTWLTPNGKNLYVHRLAVHPDFQGQGLARKLMDFAEARGRKMSFASIRLDTFSLNKRNQQFYELRGYTKLGDIYFPNQSQHPFHCFELIL